MNIFKSFTIFTGIYIGIVIVMFFIGILYNVGLDSLYGEIFKIMLIICITLIISWVGIFIYRENT